MLSHKTLVMLLGVDPSLTPNDPLPIHHPQVTFAYTKHLWMANQKEKAYRLMFLLSIIRVQFSPHKVSISFKDLSQFLAG